jgi:hypothetical protein
LRPFPRAMFRRFAAATQAEKLVLALSDKSECGK